MNTNNIQKVNYQKILDKITDKIEKECAEGENRPALFLHACCAPCSSYVLEYLSRYFTITLFYFNPNIYPPEEYHRREAELERFVEQAGYHYPVVELPYDPQEFYTAVKGLESEPEKGARCTVCYRLRLEQAARYAAAHGMEAVTLEKNLSRFTDKASVSAWAVPAMNWAVGQGLINGSGSNLVPKAQATRAQVAAIIHRYLER